MTTKSLCLVWDTYTVTTKRPAKPMLVPTDIDKALKHGVISASEAESKHAYCKEQWDAYEKAQDAWERETILKSDALEKDLTAALKLPDTSSAAADKFWKAVYQVTGKHDAKYIARVAEAFSTLFMEQQHADNLSGT